MTFSRFFTRTIAALSIVTLASFALPSAAHADDSVNQLKNDPTAFEWLEGGAHLFSSIQRLVASGIPVVGHLGLTPQSVHQLGGYGLQAREGAAADRLYEEALGLEQSGCCALVLEKVPAEVAARVARALHIPVIGIGAGSGVDGQVLVSQDMLGMEDSFSPKFLRRFAQLGDLIKGAVGDYITAVKERSFPSESESY